MAYNPIAYFQLAEELYEKAVGDDARLRSSISRAYYAALLVARDSAGLEPAGRDTHEQIVSHYKKAEPAVANWLGELRASRNKADYRPKETIPRRTGGNALMTARKVLVQLQALPEVPAEPPAPAPQPTKLH